MSKQIDKVFHDVLKKTYEEYELLFTKEATTEYKNAMIQGVLETCEEDPPTARFFTFILPLTHILSQLFTHSRSVFNKIVSWVEEKNLFSFVPRLKKDVVYEILLSLNVDISKSILGKLDCDEDTYRGLCDNLQNKTVFMSLVGQCNTSGISRYLWTAYFPIAVKSYVSAWVTGNAEEDDAAEMSSILRTEVQIVNDDELAQGYKIGARLDVINDNAAFDFFYAVFLWYYFEQTKKTRLDEKTALELKSVFAQPVFKKQFEEISQLYYDGKLIQHLNQLAESHPELRNLFDITATTDTAQLTPQTEVGKDTPISRKTAQKTDDDSETEDFRDATSEHKAEVLYNVIEELLNRVEGRVGEFLSADYDLADLKAIFESILIADAGDNKETQQAIIDELSGNKRVSLQSPYYYKGQLWLQPFFYIIGHLFNKGVLICERKETDFVKALFPDKHDKSLVHREVYLYDKKFINTCRAKVSLGNTNPPKKWKKWFEWIDTLL